MLNMANILTFLCLQDSNWDKTSSKMFIIFIGNIATTKSQLYSACVVIFFECLECEHKLLSVKCVILTRESMLALKTTGR